jgi:hypothetical protein
MPPSSNNLISITTLTDHAFLVSAFSTGVPMLVLNDVDKQRADVQFDTYSTTWREVIGQYKDGDLIINPDYQRLFRWSIDQQTQYIESILLGIPSPPLFFAQNKDGKFEVIDGLQRVSTLLKFFAFDVFKEKPAPAPSNDESDQNNIRVPAKLAAGPMVESLEGYTSETLPEALVRTIRYARITIIPRLREDDSRGGFPWR